MIEVFLFLIIKSAYIWPCHFGYSHNIYAVGKDAEGIVKKEE